MKWFSDFPGFYDFYGFVMHMAPDFPEEDFLSPEHQLDLEKAFQLLRDGLRFVDPPLKLEELEQISANLTQAQKAFESNAEVKGARLLQELQKQIFK